jgi:hypothetical protein
MAKGERPKREGRKAKKAAPKSVNLSSASIGASSDVEVIKKKRKPKVEDD